MSSRLGPIDVFCDAPPYSVVRASRWVGMLTPEDVRWCRVSNVLWEEAIPYDGRGWALFLETGGAAGKRCRCGGGLPRLERCTFTFRTGRHADYLLGQCGRCRTVLWEEARPFEAAPE